MVSTLDFESNNPSSILGMSFLFLFMKSIHANDMSKLLKKKKYMVVNIMNCFSLNLSKSFFMIDFLCF